LSDNFSRFATAWWDPNGPFATLHAINPVRLAYIERFTDLAGKKVLDIGTGGGILAESMVRKGATVTGIDINAKLIEVAKAHAQEEGLDIDYRLSEAQSLLPEKESFYDIVTCYEVLEHVDSPSLLIQTTSKLLREGGLAFFATINRTPKAYVLAVLGAEYVLGLLPKGTHDYRKFIKPSELVCWCEEAGFTPLDLHGMFYNPFNKKAGLSNDVSVNYFLGASL
jgi:2-polyprenyl-6-hydroxyphenyl methylase/3-demethylubiquinone-9 3-methyltransferase